MTGCGPIATEIHVSCHVGNQDKSGLVVLNVNFVARDPKPTLARSSPAIAALI